VPAQRCKQPCKSRSLPSTTTQLRKTVLDLLLDGVPPKAPAPALATPAPAAKRRGCARNLGENMNRKAAASR
jgi:hypothetical protein